MVPSLASIWSPDQEVIVKYKGIFDMEGLVKVVYNWFESRKMQWHQPVFKDKSRPTGKEEEMKIVAFRNDTEYYRVRYELFFRTWDLMRVEVIQNGQKRFMEKGRMKCTIRLYFELDYQNRWSGSRFQHALQNFFDKYIVLRKLQVIGDKLEYEAMGLQEVMKQYLNMSGRGNQFADMW